MSKHILLILIFQLAYTAYVVNQDGEDCDDAPPNPTKESDCTSYNTEDTACCYAEIDFNRKTVKKCIPIEKDARFELNYLSIFTYDTYKDVTATFHCGQKDKICGMNDPSKLFQCTEHSSTTKSCCFLQTPTYTECVLSDKKYTTDKTFTLFKESVITCGEKMIKVGIFNKFIIGIIGIIMFLEIF